MKLKSFGCSFIWGSDLADDRCLIDGRASNSTWPALLAQHLGYTYSCHAWPGSGNLRILQNILDQATINEPTFFVVGWTWVDRFDYNFYSDPNEHVEHINTTWRTIMPMDQDARARFYYKDLHSQYRDKLSTLMCVKMAIDVLQQKGHQFIMTYMDELMFESRWHTSPGMADLQNYIRPHMTRFDEQSFLDWSRIKGYPISELWHPLEQAHRSAADYVINVFDKQKTNDPAQQVRA
jgi:hypothetical protein